MDGRSARAAASVYQVPPILGSDLAMSGRDVQILGRIEPEITLWMSADRDGCLLEALRLARARSTLDAQLDRHQPLGALALVSSVTARVLRARNHAAPSISSASSMTAISVPVLRRARDTAGDSSSRIGRSPIGGRGACAGVTRCVRGGVGRVTTG